MTVFDKVAHSDLDVSIDGQEYSLSKFALSQRSTLLATIFKEQDPAMGVQEAWSRSPKGIATFSQFLHGLYTGIIDIRVPQILLDYFMTSGVGYGEILVSVKSGHIQEAWSIPAQKLTEIHRQVLMKFHDQPGSVEHKDYANITQIRNICRGVPCAFSNNGWVINGRCGEAKDFVRQAMERGTIVEFFACGWSV